MRLIIRKTTTKSFVFWGAAAAVAIIFALCAFFFMHGRADALTGSGRLLTIHDRGEEKVMLSDAATVGDALKNAGVTLDSHDAVEPSVSEKLVASEYQINIYRARPVTVTDGPMREKIVTAYQTSEQIVKDAGLSLYPEDTTTLARSDDLLSDGAGLELTIHRATAFSFTLYGTTSEARTQAKTVGDMLKEKNVVLGANDRASVPLSTPISTGLAVQVWREGKQTITVEEPVAFETKQIQDADQEVGYKAVQTPGANGKQNVTYEIDIRDGKEVGRTKIAGIVTQAPTVQVVVVGTKSSNTFGGDFAAALARLRSCEAGGRYTTNTGNGYYGAYQYNISTWAGYGGYTLPSDAPAALQDERAWQTYQKRGWQPWPSCSKSQGLQDIYR
jgi:uncharacterized protein YabE (DUF348 family)